MGDPLKIFSFILFSFMCLCVCTCASRNTVDGIRILGLELQAFVCRLTWVLGTQHSELLRSLIPRGLFYSTLHPMDLII